MAAGGPVYLLAVERPWAAEGGEAGWQGGQETLWVSVGAVLAAAGWLAWEPAVGLLKVTEWGPRPGFELPISAGYEAGLCLRPTEDRRNPDLTGFSQSVLLPPPLGGPPNHLREKRHEQANLVFIDHT